MARKPKMDTILAEAVDAARHSLAEIAMDSEIGEHLGVTVEGERLVTHRFVSQKKGYHGWAWYATLARVPRAKAKDLTICEVGIVAGEQSLLAPAWVPWADRLAKEEIEAAQAADNAEAEGTQAPEGDSAQGAPERPSGDVEESGAAETEAEGVAQQARDDNTEQDGEYAGEADEDLAVPKSPARRQVRRRRTAQRTAARRRAAQRNRARKDG